MSFSKCATVGATVLILAAVTFPYAADLLL